ncbi:hypothetical protein JTE90_008422 [Oedothorax gibbosus]|uniref:Outer dynein arm-docking complex subunit 4 n=1 Tax=Oedothorax gibbosus TaxID=931172 RepID=A0AAV6UVN2_9ARAC|nr:hypothetical protein JTE90_008422 [Oedothorax gibbosus]
MDFDFEDEDDDQQRSKEPKIPLSVYISQGNCYQKLHLFSKAIACFEAGLRMEPNSEKCRLGRAKCLMFLAQFSEAQKEAEAALVLNPSSLEAKSLKAEAQYLLGDFEQAFITYNRAHKTRPNFDCFR